ncbi:MAG: aminotransferase class III-fold pyridoxal phosphate-dependent enzyme, partial [Sphaerochaetaceae bacterium]|nr:aminotransferase class III-fold pyridoxal phosphate-dependent enzyme [Sphaerochaetaceae bacterium]
MNTFELDKEYVASTYARFDLNLVKGKGSKAYDEKGKEYIDLGTGIGVTAFGFCDEEWVKAVNAQLNSLQHTSNLYYTNPCALLAKALCEKTGMKKVFFSNSGAESNEAAIKAIRLYAEENKGKDYYTILTLENSFHGRTLATLAATGQDHFHEHFGPLPEGFVTIEPTREALFEACEKYKVAGIMFEAIRGEGGVIPMDKEFAKALTDAAKIYDIVLCADEVQCGNGRTGQYFGYMKLGLEPDVVSTAKGLGGGLPIGATLLGKKVENVFKPGLNGTTFGGNPVVCAGALSIINR